MKRRLLILLPLAVLSAGLHAQDTGYKITRPDGTVEFTDRPSAGAQQITLPKSQGYQARPPLPRPPPRHPPSLPGCHTDSSPLWRRSRSRPSPAARTV